MPLARPLRDCGTQKGEPHRDANQVNGLPLAARWLRRPRWKRCTGGERGRRGQGPVRRASWLWARCRPSSTAAAGWIRCRLRRLRAPSSRTQSARKGCTPRGWIALGMARARLNRGGWTPWRRSDPDSRRRGRPGCNQNRVHRNGCRVSRPAPAGGARGWQARAESVRWGRGHVADGNMPHGMRAVGPYAANTLFRRNRGQASPRHRCRAVGRQSFDETLAGRPDRPPSKLLRFRHSHLPAGAWRQPQSPVHRTAPDGRRRRAAPVYAGDETCPPRAPPLHARIPGGRTSWFPKGGGV